MTESRTPPVEERAEEYETIQLKHGHPACADCGGLLAVAYKPGRESQTGHSGEIAAKMFPEPADDIAYVQCGSCGTILWGEADE